MKKGLLLLASLAFAAAMLCSCGISDDTQESPNYTQQEIPEPEDHTPSGPEEQED